LKQEVSGKSPGEKPGQTRSLPLEFNYFFFAAFFAGAFLAAAFFGAAFFTAFFVAIVVILPVDYYETKRGKIHHKSLKMF
jgi:hypothetical protein